MTDTSASRVIALLKALSIAYVPTPEAVLDLAETAERDRLPERAERLLELAAILEARKAAP